MVMVLSDIVAMRDNAKRVVDLLDDLRDACNFDGGLPNNMEEPVKLLRLNELARYFAFQEVVEGLSCSSDAEVK
jgi:hypothetical protein